MNKTIEFQVELWKYTCHCLELWKWSKALQNLIYAISVFSLIFCHFDFNLDLILNYLSQVMGWGVGVNGVGRPSQGQRPIAGDLGPVVRPRQNSDLGRNSKQQEGDASRRTGRTRGPSWSEKVYIGPRRTRSKASRFGRVSGPAAAAAADHGDNRGRAATAQKPRSERFKQGAAGGGQKRWTAQFHHGPLHQSLVQLQYR